MIFGTFSTFRQHGLACAMIMAALAWMAPANAAELHIEVTGARGTDGHVAIALFAAPGVGFPFDEGLAAQRVRVPIDSSSGLCATTISDLPEGDYAVAVYHDDNDSGKLETNLLGMPKKAYGFSNNPKRLMRAAHFDEARFELPKDGATITITLE